MRISDWSSDVCSSDLHIQMAIHSCLISTITSAVNDMSSQISNYIQMAVSSCIISTTRSKVDAMSSQVSNHIHVAVSSCIISTTDRTSVVWGTSVYVRVDLGGRRIIKKKKKKQK